MDGVVVLHEHRIGFIVLRDEAGDFAVAELLTSDDIERGDVINGEFAVPGSGKFLNKANNEELELSIHGSGMSESEAIRLIQKKTNG